MLRRITLIIAAIIAALAVLILFAPRAINTRYVREAFISSLSEKIGGELCLKEIRLSVLPRPHIEINDGRLSIPQSFQADWKKLLLSVRLLPLLFGRIQISTISVERPEIRITTKREATQREDERIESISAWVIQKIKPLAEIAAAANPNIKISFQTGNLDLRHNAAWNLLFKEINGRIVIKSKQCQIRLETQTDFCEKFKLDVNTDIEALNSSGFIHLAGFRPQHLPQELAKAGYPWLGESLINLDLDFKTDGTDSLEAHVKGSIPQLTILGERESEPVVLQVKTFSASLLQDNSRFEVVLQQSALEEPKLSVAANFLCHKPAGPVALQIQASEIDVVSARQIALAIDEKSPVVNTVFTILRNGRLQTLNLGFQGRSFADLGNFENMSLSTELRQGDILIPGIDLNATDVEAKIEIKNKTLSAEKIQARYNTILASEGSLQLGLWEKQAPFHLDIAFNADLREIPPILNQLVKDEQVLTAINRVRINEGRASGRLVFGKTLSDISVTAKVSEFTLSALVSAVPAALIVQGTGLTYEAAGVFIERMEGRLKNSSFLINSGKILWLPEPTLEIPDGSAELIFNEIYPLLSTQTPFQNGLKNVQFANGSVAIHRLRLRGPLSDPGNWKFQTEGAVRNIRIKSDELPATLNIRRGGFKITPKELTISQAETAIMDSSLTISSRLRQYQKGVQSADVSFQGIIGPKVTQWMHSKLKIPWYLAIRPPLHLKNCRLNWLREGETAFSGDFVFPDDLNVSASATFDSNHIHIKNLTIQDRISNAAFAFWQQQNHPVKFELKGSLQKETVDKLLLDNRTLQGSIQGDFKLTYAIDKPVDTQLSGTLYAENLSFMQGFGIPLEARHLAATGRNRSFGIDADLLFEKKRLFRLTGQGGYSSSGIQFDAALTTEDVVLDDIFRVFLKKEKKDEKTEKDKFWDFPIEGTIRLNSAAITYGKYTWRTVYATAALHPEKIDVNIHEALLCGISTPGSITLFPQSIQLELDLSAYNQDVKDSAQCLIDQKSKVEGSYRLSGLLTGQGPPNDLTHFLTGYAELEVENGRIYTGRALRVLKEILAVLNITETYRGKLPDLAQDGFGFNSIKAKLKLENNFLIIEEGFIDGLIMEVAAKGMVNLRDEKINMTLLAAPLKTVDSVIKKIPFVRDILGGSLLSVPFGVSGNLNEPKVVILPPEAVAEGLLGILTRTLQLPVRIIEPLILHQAK